MMKIGLIGLGQISRQHITAIQRLDGLELKAVSDVDKSRDPKILGVNFFVDYHKMFNDKGIDAVAIATPNYLHAPMSIEALRKGKHVLVEKPMTTNLEDAQSMIEAAKSSSKVLVVAYHFQFMPEIQYFLQTKKKYGRIKSFEAHFTCPIEYAEGWRLTKELSGGGVCIDNGVNVLSVLRLFIPDLNIIRATFEYEQRNKIKDPLVEDFVEIDFKCNDISGKVVVDWRSQNKAQYKTKLRTSRGEIILEHLADDQFVNTMSYEGRIVYKGQEDRYLDIYKDFIRRVNQADSNATQAFEDLRMVINAYKRYGKIQR